MKNPLLATILGIALIAAVAATAAAVQEQDEDPAPASGEKTTTVSAEKKYPEQDPAKGAIAGKVTFKGTPPELEPIQVPQNNKDAPSCGKQLADPTLVVAADGAVQDTVIFLHGYASSEKPTPQEPVLDNSGCMFKPYVVAATRGSKIQFTNNDAFLHNTNVMLKNPTNKAVMPGRPVPHTLRQAGWSPVACNVHPWMQANILVFDHECFDVTGADGTFKLVNVPPGEYEVAVWHRKLAFSHELAKPKMIAGKLTIEAGKTAELNVELTMPEG